MKTMIYCTPQRLININYILMLCVLQMIVCTASYSFQRLFWSPLKQFTKNPAHFGV